MIILMGKNALDQRIARMLSNTYKDSHLVDFQEGTSHIYSNDSKCFIIDLDSQTPLCESYTPDHFAYKLKSLNLTPNVSHIYLIHSDLSAHHRSIVFAQRLARCLAKGFQHKTNIHVSTNLNSEKTILMPPADNETEWCIYGMGSRDAKQLVWHGKDLMHWMDDPQRTFNGTAFAWGQK